MRTLVSGLTGQTGAATARHLLAAGHAVRALVRSPDKAAAWRDQGVELVAGSLDHAPDLAAALDGVDAAWVLLPPIWGAANLFTEVGRITDAWLQALATVPVPRVVVLSSVAVHQPSGTGPIATLRPLEAGLADRPGVTFLRAAYFQENLGMSLPAVLEAGVLPVFFGADTPLDMVATDDIGAEAARLLVQAPATAPRIVQLAGPRRESFRSVAAALSGLLGRDITPVEGPPSALAERLAGMGAGHLAALYAEMSEGIAAGLVDWEPGLPVHRGPTPVEATLRSMLG
jgi:uncharacterized protein YbjT (DUF2867 family)